MSGHREGVNKRKFSSIVEVISDENDNDHNDEVLAKRPRTPKVGMSDNDNLETNNKPSPSSICQENQACRGDHCGK